MNMMENLMLELANVFGKEEVLISLTSLLGGGYIIFVILYLLITGLFFSAIFSIAPAFWYAVKKKKDSNKHGDSTSEFEHLSGSKMKMIYSEDTIFYPMYMSECDKVGIGPRVKKKERE